MFFPLAIVFMRNEKEEEEEEEMVQERWWMQVEWIKWNEMEWGKGKSSERDEERGWRKEEFLEVIMMPRIIHTILGQGAK